MRQPFPSESPSQMPPTTLSAPAADSEPRATWAVPPVVLLVDDHPVFSEALAGVLVDQKGWVEVAREPHGVFDFVRYERDARLG